MAEFEYHAQQEEKDSWSIFSPTENGYGKRLAKAARALGLSENVSIVIDESGKKVGVRIKASQDMVGLILYEATKDQSIFGSW